MKSEHPLLSRDCLMICYASGAPATTPQCRRASLHSAFDPAIAKKLSAADATGTRSRARRQSSSDKSPVLLLHSAAAFCFCAEPALLTRYSLSNTGETSRREAVIAESDP